MYENLDTVRNASHLLPTGGSLVRGLADEIELLRKELQQRDEFVAQQIDMILDAIRQCIYGSDRWVALINEHMQLVAVLNENGRIHKNLRKVVNDE